MSLCKVGGYVLYSTCTLSTAQNQAVIQSVLADGVELPSNAKFAIVDPTRLIQRCTATLTPKIGIQIVPAYADSSATVEPIGALVMPRISANYGPTFFCKLKRVE